MSTHLKEWKKMLESSLPEDVFSVTFKLGGGRGDGSFRAAVGRFNGYDHHREIIVSLKQDILALGKVCSEGVWPSGWSSDGRRDIKFTIRRLSDIDQFIDDITPAVESIRRVQVAAGI